MRELVVKVGEKGEITLDGGKFTVGELRQIGQAIIQIADGVQVEFKKSENLDHTDRITVSEVYDGVAPQDRMGWPDRPYMPGV